MENIKETIEILNDLIQINNDRILSYQDALNEIDDEDIKPLFLELIDQSHGFKMQLGTEIEVLGTDIEKGTSVSGKIHRAWLKIKETFSGHDDKSILEECEFSEDAIKEAYQSAIEEEYLPEYIKDILIEQANDLIDAHDEIKALRDNA
jgi:uncharacterized protein (TIGR02284 family)